MPKYAITEKAGRFVAGHNNTGIGTVLDLTERAAAYEVALGSLVRVGEPAEVAQDGGTADVVGLPPEPVEADPEPDQPPASPKRRGRKAKTE